MESLQEAFLMLGIDNLNEEAQTEIKNSHWRLCCLILHSFNLKNGLICTGFDEDDPQVDLNDNLQGILNLPQNINQITREMFTIRYKCKFNKDEDLIVKIIPENIENDDGTHDKNSQLNINAMGSLSNDQIHSCELKIGQFNFVQADKLKLDNIDQWAEEKPNSQSLFSKVLITQQYKSKIFEKLAKKGISEQKKAEEEQKNNGFFGQSGNFINNQDPYPRSDNRNLQEPRNQIFPQNPYFTPQSQHPRIIGDPLDPLRIGGTGPQGNLVGPNSGIFNPNGMIGGGRLGPFGQGGQNGGRLDPSLGGYPDMFGQMGAPDDINPQFPNPRRNQNPFGGNGGGFGGLGGGGFGGSGPFFG